MASARRKNERKIPRLRGRHVKKAIRRELRRDAIAKVAVMGAGYGVGGLVAKRFGPRIAPHFAGLAKHGKLGEFAAGAAPGWLAKEAVEWTAGAPVNEARVRANRRLAARVGVNPEKVSRFRAQLPGYLPSFDVIRARRKMRRR